MDLCFTLLIHWQALRLKLRWSSLNAPCHQTILTCGDVEPLVLWCLVWKLWQWVLCVLWISRCCLHALDLFQCMPLESGAVWRQGQCLGLLIGILELFLNSCSGLVGAVLGEVTSVWEYHYMGGVRLHGTKSCILVNSLVSVGFLLQFLKRTLYQPSLRSSGHRQLLCCGVRTVVYLCLVEICST